MKYDAKNILRYIFIFSSIIASQLIRTEYGYYYYYFPLLPFLMIDYKNKDNSFKWTTIACTLPWIWFITEYILNRIL